MKRHKSAKSLSGWLNIAKDGVAEDKSSRNTKRQTAKRKEHSSVGWKTERHVANNSGDVPWCVKHAPTDDMSLLAVHKKKIQEVQQWIQFALSKTAKHPILLLTGPSGCGKTATIQALSKQLSYEIIEWNDPIDSRPRIEDNSRTLTEGSYSGINWELYESQTNKFLNFLKRANRYPSLQLVGGGVANKHREGGVAANYGNCKIVLIEELPNVFVRDPKKLHQLLKSVLYGFLYPLVFIVSESQHSRSSLFPPSIIQDLDIHHIHFNPIARTSTVKVLQRIIDSEQIDSVNKSILDGIADCCIGDIRAAINILQFTSTTGSVSGDMWMECDTNGINDKDRNTQLVGVAGREHPLFLFRALGKILYPKRDNTAIIRTLPPHLSHLERPQLLTNPEEVYESAHLSTDFFSSYLHQNYIDFFNDIDDLDLAIGYLSDSDVIGHAWNDVMDKHRSLATSCSCSVACRGLIFANQQTLSSKWRPMYKPQWTTVYQQYINNTQTARDLFVHLSGFAHSHLWMPIDLLTELLPYMAFNSVPLKNHAQISFLHTLTTFKGTHCNQHIEQLGEMEQDDNTLIHSQPGSQTANSIGMSLSQQQTSSQTLTEEDEIEEFDD